MSIHTGPNEDPKYPPYHPTLVAHRDAYKLARAHLTDDEASITQVLTLTAAGEHDRTANLIMALVGTIGRAHTSLCMDNAADPYETIDDALSRDIPTNHRHALELVKAYLPRDEGAIREVLWRVVATDGPDPAEELIRALGWQFANMLKKLHGDEALGIVDLALTEIDVVPFRTDLDAPGEDA